MRIRLKKGVALIGTIAGAAVATALIVFNVNQGNSVNVSDMEGTGILEGIEGAFQQPGAGEADKPTVVADAEGTGAAAAAGVLGSAFGEEQSTVTPTPSSAESDTTAAASEGNDGTAASGETAPVQESEGYAEAPAVVQGDTSAPAQEAQTYVEVVPQTRTETVVSEKAVTVETPVIVTEQVTEQVEVQSVNFIEQSSEAAAQELTTNRRAQEAQAAYEADQERLKAAAEAARAGDYKEKTGDDLPDVSGGEFIIFY